MRKRTDKETEELESRGIEILENGKDENKYLFTNGNELWKFRTTIGRKKLFEPTEKGEIELITKVREYFQLKRTVIKKETVKGGQNSGKIIDVELQAPYTIESLCAYLGIDVKTFRNYSKDPEYSVFFPLFTYIDTIIKSQQYDGALLGTLDARFVALLNGIKEQVDITSNDESIGITMVRFDLGGIKPVNQYRSIDDIQESTPIE